MAGAAAGYEAPTATLSGYWLTGGVFELQYTCTGAGGYLLHTWFRDARGEVHAPPVLATSCLCPLGARAACSALVPSRDLAALC